ncbi:thiamine phosphate synthase [candidate division WOR-3 bacterium]|nr:thiamine phosphate synthase [candidate division WOR-3 bacterium]
MKKAIKGLYFVTDPLLTLGRSVQEISYQACRSGVDILQFRDKSLPDDEFLETALYIRKITREFNTLFILNDRAHLVGESKADGVHVGLSDITPGKARDLIGDEKILGVSFHAEKDALLAQDSGADYVALSPVFATETKKDLGAPAGFEGISYFSKLLKIPLVAIGGINTSNVVRVISAGADCAAVVTAISLSEDIKKTVMELREKIREGFESRNLLH